jgi:hypothetical protein
LIQIEVEGVIQLYPMEYWDSISKTTASQGLVYRLPNGNSVTITLIR